MISQQFLQAQKAFANPDGGYPYLPGDCSYSEPTLHLLLAFFAWNFDPKDLAETISWCRKLQNPDGSVGNNLQFPDQGIMNTSVFAVVCHHLNLMAERDQAIDFILKFKSRTFVIEESVNQLNSQLVGWSWAPHTFSWVEPTSWALYALRLAGKELHPRAVEGREILKDRCIPDGGWNVGNKIVYNNVLIPFLDNTAMAILALTSQEKPLIDQNLTLLEREIPNAESLYSLAWIGLCLRHFKPLPQVLVERLTHLLEHPHPETVNLSHIALGCLALAEREVFFP